MSIEVIGAGFGRTGTMFLAALDDLGFGPCYHMSELFEHPKHIELWEAAAKGQPVDWNEIFRGYPPFFWRFSTAKCYCQHASIPLRWKLAFASSLSVEKPQRLGRR